MRLTREWWFSGLNPILEGPYSCATSSSEECHHGAQFYCSRPYRRTHQKQAAAALKKIGLTVSDAFRLLMVRVAAEKNLPFEPLNPNAETIAAMKAARRSELIKTGKPENLLRSLNAGD
jgi:DNA-damage-inducible protein J